MARSSTSDETMVSNLYDIAEEILVAPRVEASTVEQKSLATYIVSAQTPSEFDQTVSRFVPEGKIKAFLTEQQTRDELKLDREQRLTDGQKDELVTWVRTRAPKVLALAVQCLRGKPEGAAERDLALAMVMFRRVNMDDSSLPIAMPVALSGDTGETLPVTGSRFVASRRAAWWDTCFPAALWGNPEISEFYKKQWELIAPVFTVRKHDYNLDRSRILPVVSKQSDAEGAFGRVFHMWLHEDHQDSGNLEVAIKEIYVNRSNRDNRQNADSLWDREARALKAFNQLNHEHITKSLAAIRRGTGRYFMFPWANGGSLHDYWDASPQHSPTADSITQAVTQLRGLADALARIHDFKVLLTDEEAVGIDDHETSQATADAGDTEDIVAPAAAGSLVLPQLNLPDEGLEDTDDEGTRYFRHGDLKPQNILSFVSQECPGLGVLKLADMGLAKRHVVRTQDRRCLTTTRYGTVQYAPPEVMTAPNTPRSRLYDSWSMGCIILEFIIWILHGNDTLKVFYRQLRVSGENLEVCQFFRLRTETEAAVHPVVQYWIKHIEDNDPECARDSAIKSLLNLVKKRLLVIDLPPGRVSALGDGNLPVARPFLQPEAGEGIRNYRCDSRILCDSLSRILDRMKNEDGYTCTNEPRGGIETPSNSDAADRVTAWENERRAYAGDIDPQLDRTRYLDYDIPPLEDWQYPDDPGFASKALQLLGYSTFQTGLAVAPPAPRLCEECQRLDFWAPGFGMERTEGTLDDRAARCALCHMLLSAYNRVDEPSPEVAFDRSGFIVQMTGIKTYPVLSFFRCTDLAGAIYIPLGFPELLKPGSNEFFGLVNLWLKDCDENHEECWPGATKAFLPTRLVDVGSTEAPKLQLVETASRNIPGPDINRRYLALSHPWGDPSQHPPFRTIKSNVESFKTSIPEEELPATFVDAVAATRAMGVRYLWIDSLCIIQEDEATGDKGDFSTEAPLMADVYGCAYCVLAATRARGQRDGFLGPQPQREHLKLQTRTGDPFYTCPVDDFSNDVLGSPLCRRGWVLQERALARRTVFFAERQTYFECGEGIRCQSLAKMQNNMAALLGDPNFPKKAMRASHGLRLKYFQGLFKQYSKLELSRKKDRAIAMAGLEKRLRDAYDAQGAFGILESDKDRNRSYFPRSLLWKRHQPLKDPTAQDNTTTVWLQTIPDLEATVPSWSWMAYDGAIDFVDLPLGGMDWNPPGDAIASPWLGSVPLDATGKLQLSATVRSYNVARTGAVDDASLVFDCDRLATAPKPEVVVVARPLLRGHDANRANAMHYVLIVEAVAAGAAAGGPKVYRRVGAGYMRGKYIDFDKPGTPALIR